MKSPRDILTPKQIEAVEQILLSPARHILLAGGSRSGKTFLLVWAVIQRALAARKSRHAILRFRFGHVKQSIGMDTFPKVMQTCFPDVPYDLSKSDWFVTFPNGSQIWFAGLDDKQRTEKILGTEFATVYLNEASQISWPARNMVLTRLAQLAHDEDGDVLPLREYIDCNPPSKAHWLYKLFLAHQDPEDSRKPVPAQDYLFMRLNPHDNLQNMNAEYIRNLESLPARDRERFLHGNFSEATPGALFSADVFEKWRVMDGEEPEYLRVVVAVDPSGADDEENTDNDAIGIVVAGLGVDGVAYLMADLTCKVGPATWGRIATDAFINHEADRVVGEVNYGGAMVGYVIRQARPNTPYRAITASRGKAVRAEPVSALMEAGKVRIVGHMRELEEELLGFTTHGYRGEGSPNRADAAVWAISDLFPALMKAQNPAPEPKPVMRGRRGSGQFWNTL